MRPGTFVTAKVRGIVVWEGEFRSSHDAHVFTHALVSGRIFCEPWLWDLPTPMWTPGFNEPGVEYLFSTTVTATGTGNVTAMAGATKVDVEAWGPGGSGAAEEGGGVISGGGGGGAYAGSFGIACVGGTTVLYWHVYAGGLGVTGSVIGKNGAGLTWINVGTNSSPASSAAGAVADIGLGGTAASSGGKGGLVANCIGAAGHIYGGGNGYAAVSVNGGGGSSGGSANTGLNATSATGAASAGVDSGAGSSGTGISSANGTQPGGGSGGVAQLGTSGNGGAGQVRYTFYIAVSTAFFFFL